MTLLIAWRTSSGRIPPSSSAYLGWRTWWLVVDTNFSITRNFLLSQVSSHYVKVLDLSVNILLVLSYSGSVKQFKARPIKFVEKNLEQ